MNGGTRGFAGTFGGRGGRRFEGAFGGRGGALAGAFGGRAGGRFAGTFGGRGGAFFLTGRGGAFFGTFRREGRDGALGSRLGDNRATSWATSALREAGTPDTRHRWMVRWVTPRRRARSAVPTARHTLSNCTIYDPTRRHPTSRTTKRSRKKPTRIQVTTPKPTELQPVANQPFNETLKRREQPASGALGQTFGQGRGAAADRQVHR